MFLLVSVLAIDERASHDDEIHAERAVADLVHVAVEALIHVCIAAPSVDLGKTCKTWLHCDTLVPTLNLFAEALDVLRTLRTWADEAHVAFEDVPELRDLVEVPGADEFANFETAGIVLIRPAWATGLRIELHAAELDDGEEFTAAANALLGIDHRAGR